MTINLNNIRVALTHGTNGRHGGAFRLRLEDNTSGQMILEAEIPDSEAANLFGASEARGRATIFGMPENSKLGREHTHTVEQPPIEIVHAVTGRDSNYWPYERDGKGPLNNAISEWAERRKAELGAATAEVRIAHGKANVIFRSYGEPTGRDQQER